MFSYWLLGRKLSENFALRDLGTFCRQVLVTVAPESITDALRARVLHTVFLQFTHSPTLCRILHPILQRSGRLSEVSWIDFPIKQSQ